MYRVFKRDCWKPNKAWPDGYEPNAEPMDQCETVEEFDSKYEAIEFCQERNEAWMKYMTRICSGTATMKELKKYYESPRYEWTET